MEFADHIVELKKLMFYAASRIKNPSPYQIPAEINVVELITGGVVRSPGANGPELFRRGTIFWHIPGEHTIYDTTREEPYRCLVFHFHVRSAERTAPRVSTWRGSDEALEEFVQQVHTAYESSRNNPFQKKLLDSYCASELLMHACELKNLHAESVMNIQNSPDEIILRGILSYIDQHIAGNLSAAAISEALRIPRNRFFSLFKKFMRQSPHEYIAEKRLDLSRRYLESSNFTIKEIAAACGFEHIEVFHRSFVRRFNETPLAYRRSHLPYNNLPLHQNIDHRQ